ncbi:MAG: hypothetical protein ACRENF_01965, partial [Thermodesulfobacteriota bacterium]
MPNIYSVSKSNISTNYCPSKTKETAPNYAAHISQPKQATLASLSPQRVTKNPFLALLYFILSLFGILQKKTEEPTPEAQTLPPVPTKKVVQLKQQFPEKKAADVFGRIQLELAAGSLTLSRELIYQKYPDLKGLSTQEQAAFEQILSRSWLKNKLSKAAEMTQGSKTEQDVLQGLGYDMKSYEDKEFLKTVMTITLQDYLSKDELPPLEQLKTEVQKRAFEIRLKNVGVKQGDIENLRKV